MKRLTLLAYAKVNLHLNIGPKRADGYHSLETIFQEISLCDTLTFSLSKKEDFSIQVFDQSPHSQRKNVVPGNNDNLVIRALSLLQKELGVTEGIDVTLTKRIPVGAGLGGGSSNAACALWAGWLLWKQKPKSSYRRGLIPQVLLKIAIKCGADVAFFLKGGRAKATGIGEKLNSLRVANKKWLVLVYPNVHVSTPDAYLSLDDARGDIAYVEQENLIRTSVPFFNSFEPVVFKKFPKIKNVHNRLIDFGATGVMMSGSGSTVFGFVKNERDGKGLLKKISPQLGTAFLVKMCS